MHGIGSRQPNSQQSIKRNRKNRRRCVRGRQWTDPDQVHSEDERKKASEEAAQSKFQAYGYIPGEDEEEEEKEEEQSDSDRDDNDERDELDVMREVVIGTRRSSRARVQRSRYGYQIDTSALQLTETEEEEE
jgi:hypothetical protein